MAARGIMPHETPRSFYSLVFAAFFVLNTNSVRAPPPAQVQSAHNVIGVVGGTIHLPCDATPSLLDDRVAVILWYKNNLPDAIYTYDARNVDPSHHHHSTRDPGLGLRAKFYPGRRANMTLKGTMLEDGGRYECRADFIKAPSKTTIVEVKMIAPPRDLDIYLHSGDPVSRSLTATEGHTLRLSCVATGGIPKPKVWWELETGRINDSGTAKFEKILDDSYESLEPDMIRNDLVISPLERRHHMKHFGCYASNTNVTRPLHAQFQLILHLRPLRARLDSLPAVLQAGRLYRPRCLVDGSSPAPVITWTITLHSNTTVLSSEDLAERNTSQGFLDLIPTPSLNNAVLSCKVTHSAFPALTLVNSTTLRVEFTPRITLSLGHTLKPDDIKEDTDVYFECHIVANPKVYKIVWFHNDVEIPSDPTSGVLVQDDHLVLQGIRRSAQGKYVCKASNVAGDAESNELHIAVKYSPVCESSSVSVYRAAPGEELSIPCRVHSQPPVNSFTWTFNNSVTQERVAGNRVTWSGQESWLRYLPARAQDYGTLHCWASNDVGYQVHPCIFTVKAAGTPAPPYNCTVSNQTWVSVEVTCGDPSLAPRTLQEEDQGGEASRGLNEVTGVLGDVVGHAEELMDDTDRARYFITVRDRLSHGLVFNNSVEHYGRTKTGGVVLPIHGLTPGLDYVITLVRYNKHGWSQGVTLEAFTHRAAENKMREGQQESNQGSELLGVLSGIVSVFIVLVVGALLITLRTRSRHLSQTPNDLTTNLEKNVDKERGRKGQHQGGQSQGLQQVDQSEDDDDEALLTLQQVQPHGLSLQEAQESELNPGSELKREFLNERPDLLDSGNDKSSPLTKSTSYSAGRSSSQIFSPESPLDIEPNMAGGAHLVGYATLPRHMPSTSTRYHAVPTSSSACPSEVGGGGEGVGGGGSVRAGGFEVDPQESRFRTLPKYYVRRESNVRGGESFL